MHEKILNIIFRTDIRRGFLMNNNGGGSMLINLEKRRFHVFTSFLIMITLIMVCFSSAQVSSHEMKSLPTRMVDGEKGSVHEFNLGSSEMNGLEMNEQDQVEVEELGERVKEDFTDLSGSTLFENLNHDDRNFNIEHDFKKVYGGFNYEQIFGAIHTSDGGYAAVGTTNSFVSFPNDVNLWLLKLDENGNMLWNRSYGGSMNDEGRGLTEASNGDLILVGYSVSYGSNYLDPWIVRTDSNGNEIWNQTYHLGFTGWGMSVIETSSQEIAICGYKQNQSTQNTNDAFFIKTDGSGKEILNRTWGTDGDEVARDLIETIDGNFLLVGDSEPFNGIEMITLWKLDGSGIELWNKTYGGGAWYMGYRVEQIPTGDIFSFGLVMSIPGTGLDLVLVKTDSSGKEQWKRTYDSGGNDRPQSMTVDSTGVIMVGSCSTQSSGDDIFIVRSDLSGTKTWSRQYGGSGSDIGIEALVSPYGFYLIGYSYTWGPGFMGAFLLNLTSTGEGAQGIFRSVDMMEGISAISIKEMFYTAKIKTGSSIGIRFSDDGVNWYNSNKVPNLFTMLSTGSGKILLKNLDGFEEDLYYELTFQCSSGDPASLSSLSFVYGYRELFGTMETSTFELSGDVTWGRIGIDIDLPEGTSSMIRIRTAPSSNDLPMVSYSGPDGTGQTSYSNGDMIKPENADDKAIQVFVNLTTDDMMITPALKGINITYDLPGSILSTGVSSNTGNIDDLFNFTLTFIDPDGDPPDDVSVELDGTNSTLSPIGIDTDSTNGRLYGFETQLDAGDHSYRFFVDYKDEVLYTASLILNVLPGPLQTIDISPIDEVVTADDELQFNAIGRDRAGNTIEVLPQWQVTGGGTIDEFGHLTAEKVGTWTVFGNASGLSGQTTFTITPGDLTRVEVLTDTYSITADETVQLMGIGYDSDGNEIEIEPTWEAEGGGTIDQTGLFNGDIVGSWKVYANYSGLSAFEIIEVYAGNLSKIIIEPQEVTMNISESVQFTANGYDSDGNIVTIIPEWDGSGGHIESDGLFTAATSGTWTIYCNYSLISGEVTVTINLSQPINDDDSDDDLPDDDDGTSEKNESSNFIVVSIVIIILVIIAAVVATLLLMIKKRKEGEEQAEKQEPEVEDPNEIEQPLGTEMN